MNSRIFFSRSPSSKEGQKLFPLLKEALLRLFPNASLLSGGGERLGTPYSFFLQEGTSLLWVEVAFHLLTRETLTPYLTQAKQAQDLFPAAKLSGVWMAPDFDPEIAPLLEWVLIPIRLFRYREVVSLEASPAEPVLWIEEASLASLRRAPAIEPPFAADSFEESLPTKLRDHWDRLTREELRNFIQFEIDFACRYKQ